MRISSSYFYPVKNANSLNCRNNVRNHLYMLQADTVSFGNTSKLVENDGTKCYRINPDKVEIIKTQSVPEISEQTKKELIKRVLEAHELAQKNYYSGNITKTGYATSIGLDNGQWSCATNFNNTRNDISNICGERSSVLMAYNGFLKSLSLDKLMSKTEKTQDDFKIQYIAMSSFKPIGTDSNAMSPCTDCLSWFNTSRFFAQDAVVAGLSKDVKGNYQLILKTIQDYLPLKYETPSILQEGETLDNLEIEYTQHAMRVMNEKKLGDDTIRNMFYEAKRNYDSNHNTQISEQNIASSILTDDDTIIGAKKIDWSKRWFVEPAEFAVAKVVEKSKETKINGVCYYGDSSLKDKYGKTHNDGVVSIKTLGRLLVKKGDENTLVVTKVGDKIKVRTVNDYMPSEMNYKQIYLNDKKTLA